MFHPVENVDKFYLNIPPGAPLTADGFQFPAMETAMTKAIIKSGEMSIRKFPTLSPAKLRDLAFWKFETFSLRDLLSKEQMLSPDALQHAGHLLVKFSSEFHGRLFARGLTHFFEVLRRLGEYSPLLCMDSDPFLDIVHEHMSHVARSFDIDTIAARCPPGSSLDSFLLENLEEAFNISVRDDNIQFVLHNPTTKAPRGGGAPSVGVKRAGDVVPNRPRKASDYTRWLGQSPLPDCRVCWNSVLQLAPCANSPVVCKFKPPRDHSYPSGTTMQEKKAYLAWLKKKPESSS